MGGLQSCYHFHHVNMVKQVIMLIVNYVQDYIVHLLGKDDILHIYCLRKLGRTGIMLEIFYLILLPKYT